MLNNQESKLFKQWKVELEIKQKTLRYYKNSFAKVCKRCYIKAGILLVYEV